MARRRGFLERFNPARILRGFAEGIGRIFEPERPPRRATPPPEPSPPRREPPPRRREPADEFAQAWREHTFSRAGRPYREHKEIFDTLPGMLDEPESEQLRIWRIYLDNMVRSGGYRRNDPANPFWGASGIHPRDFDWSEWRKAQGKSTPGGRGRGK